jgi:hypothetical protein
MQGVTMRAAMLAGAFVVGASVGGAGVAQAQAQGPTDTQTQTPPQTPRPAPPVRIQCSPARVEGTQCPPPNGICPDTTLGIGGNYAVDLPRQSIVRFSADWTLPTRVRVARAGAGEIVTEEADRYFNAYVTMTIRLGDANTPITYVHSIFPITGSATPGSDRPTLRSEGTCVRIGPRRR